MKSTIQMEDFENISDFQTLFLIKDALNNLYCKKDPDKTRMLSVKKNINLMLENKRKEISN